MGHCNRHQEYGLEDRAIWFVVISQFGFHQMMRTEAGYQTAISDLDYLRFFKIVNSDYQKFIFQNIPRFLVNLKRNICQRTVVDEYVCDLSKFWLTS